jgi:hypothetical protein
MSSMPEDISSILKPPPYCGGTDGPKINVYDIKQYNVLILGESRSGKTTFRKVLKNINFVTKMEVWRGTISPISKSTLFSIDNDFIAINMLDTPGFAEASVGVNRSDDGIRNMIIEYVKRDIVRIDLILIAINGSSGINASQVSNITAVLKFLGRQVASRTCMLITHFENRSVEEESRWAEEFKSNPNMSFLTKACEGGFLFTGALDKNQFDNIALRDSYITQQRRRNVAFFNKLMNGDSVSLLSQQMMNAKCMLAMQESVLTSCMNLKNLIPEVERTWQHAIETRVKISSALKHIKDKDLLEKAERVVQELSDLGAEGKDIKTMNLDENVVKMMSEYELTGEAIRERYGRVTAMSNEFSEKDQKASLLWNEIEWCI